MTCPHCGHSFVAFDVEDNATVESMPVHCPRCGNVVKTDGILGFLSRVLGLARKSGVMILVFIVVIPLASCDRYQDWPCNEERMKTARADVEATDCVVLLRELVDASKGNIAAITRMTCLTPQMITRLLDGTSAPTRLTELSVRAVAWDFYFYKKRFWVLDLCRDWKWRKPSCWLMNLPYLAAIEARPDLFVHKGSLVINYAGSMFSGACSCSLLNLKTGKLTSWEEGSFHSRRRAMEEAHARFPVNDGALPLSVVAEILKKE